MKLHTLCGFIAAIWLVGCAAAQPARTPAPTPQPPTVMPAPSVTPTAAAPLVGAERGRVLFRTTQREVGFACATCHYWNSEARLIGPGLRGFSARVPGYNQEESVEVYARQSILEPDAFIAPGQPSYPSSLMPHTYGAVFTDDELADLIAYLLTL